MKKKTGQRSTRKNKTTASASKSNTDSKTRTKPTRNKGDRDKLRSVFGLLVFAVGVMTFLALLSYHQEDPTFQSTTPNNLYKTHNILGLVGATFADPVFKFSFGYASLVFPVLMCVIGIFIMMDQGLRKLVRPFWLTFFWAYFASVVMAMPESLETIGASNNYFPSGLIGGITADLITRYMGRFALGFTTTIALLTLLIFTFEFPVAAIPRSIGHFFGSIFRGIQEFFISIGNGLTGVWQQLTGVVDRTTAKAAGLRKPTGPKQSRVTDTANRDISLYDEANAALPSDDGLHLRDTSGEMIAEEDLRKAHSLDEDFSSVIDNDFPVAPNEKPASPTGLEFPLSTGIYTPEEPPHQPHLPVIDELPDDGPSKTADDDNYDELVAEAAAKFKLPDFNLLDADESQSKISREELMANADRLENTLANFNVKAFVKKVIEGPVITLYAVRPAEGVKISQVTNLSDDLALAMKARGIRMIAPIPGESAIGIEIPNRKPSTVYFKSIVQSEKFQNHPGQLVLGMGKTIGGEVFCADLTRMPHLLIAGATGAGKSVGINTIIASIIYRVPPSDVKFVMIDPKKLELSLYRKIKDQYLAICQEIDEDVITHPQNAVLVLRSVVNEMEDRYDTLAKMGVRDIISYNKRIDKIRESGEKSEYRKLPYIIVIIDELADLILTASREVEEPITRLAQMARAVGIHLIVATQRPSVDILTGLIKANFPTRIAYQVATRPDSKVILDMYGAEKLIGNGDMLFLPPGTGKPVRLQNPYISTEEVERMILHTRKQPKFPLYELQLTRDVPAPSSEAVKKMNQDELFDKAKEIVIRHQSGSTSLLQRKLQIGYARAGRLMDSLEQAGIVGPSQGSKARDVLITSHDDPRR